MTLHFKKPRPLTREEKPLRDARLFVIATEDSYAPREYFRFFRNPRIKVMVLPTEDTRSSPEHVLRRMDEFKEQYEVLEEDQFWLMLDTDHWIRPGHVDNFVHVCSEATRKGYQLAHSNPCFEVWLLLHVCTLEPETQFTRAAEVVARLRELLGEYSKRTIDAKYFPMSAIREAVARAETMDNRPRDRWPQSTGTHVYKVVKHLL